jgi:polyphenol oxidase
MHIVRSTLFSQFPELLFGMSTVEGGVSPESFGMNLSYNVGDDPEKVRQNRELFFSALGIGESDIAFTQQHHTNNVALCELPGIYPVSDALVTGTPGLFLSVSSGDCTPVMLYDPVKKNIAGIHAGWRGTASAIVSAALSKMKQNCGVKPENIYAFIGPSAGKCCYEVENDVARQFPQECVAEKNDGKFLLDVKRTNFLQLLENGVKEQHIEVHPDCSIHNHLYHSYRRDGKKSGRMQAIIGIKN